MSQNTAAKKKDSVWSPAVVVVAIVCAVVLVATVALALVARTGYFRRNTIMMEIGEHKINQIEFEYYYGAQYQNWAQYLSNVNLKTTKCYVDSSMTWHEYFMKETKDAIVEDYLLYEQAQKDNFKMTEASQKTLDTLPEDIASAAEINGMSVDTYLSAIYCKNMTMESFMEYVTRSQLVTDYVKNWGDTILDKEFDSEEKLTEAVEKHFKDNRLDFEVADYYYYTITATSDKTVDAIEGEFKALSGDDIEKAFKDKIKELNPDKVKEGEEFSYTSYYKEDATYSEGDDISEWLFKEDTAEKSVTVISTTKDSKTTKTAVLLLRRGKDDAKVATMRHILFKAAEKLDDNGNVVKDKDGKAVLDMEAAKAKAEKILAEFNSGDKSEDAFISFVEANTDDAASKYTGGLFEKFTEGYMTEGIDEWIFPDDDEKMPKVGDVANLETEFGYHLVYFLGYHDAWRVDVENDMKTKRYDEFLEGLKKAATVTYDDGALAKVG